MRSLLINIISPLSSSLLSFLFFLFHFTLSHLVLILFLFFPRSIYPSSCFICAVSILFSLVLFTISNTHSLYYHIPQWVSTISPLRPALLSPTPSSSPTAMLRGESSPFFLSLLLSVSLSLFFFHDEINLVRVYEEA